MKYDLGQGFGSSYNGNGHHTTVQEPPAAPASRGALVDGFWQAPEPRDPEAPQNYLGRVIAWFRPPMDLDEVGRAQLDELLAWLSERDPDGAALLALEYQSHAKLAAAEYHALEDRIRQRLLEQNAWIVGENLRAEAEAEPLRAAVQEAEAALDEAHVRAAAACSAAGCGYDPRQPSLDAVTAPPVDLAARRAPVRRRVHALATWLAPLALGLVLGETLMHSAGFLAATSFDDLRMGWPSHLVAWLLGASFYYVLGSGLRSIARRLLLWSRQPGVTDRGRRWMFGGGLALAIGSAVLPFLASAVVEGFGAHHLALDRQGGAVGVVGWGVFAAIGILMSSAFFAADFWAEVNAEDDHQVERENRQDTARAEAARLQSPAVQAALEAVSTVLLRQQALSRALRRLAAVEARVREPLWGPTADDQVQLDDARAAACGASHHFWQRLAQWFPAEPEPPTSEVHSLGAEPVRPRRLAWWAVGVPLGLVLLLAVLLWLL